MSMTQISLDKQTLATLDASASLRSRSREETLREAVNSLAEYDAWFQRMVAKGLASVERGEVFTQEAIEADDKLLRKEILQRSKG